MQHLSEWLSDKRPGWRLVSTTPGYAKLPGNPPESAIEMLNRARQFEPGAHLCYWIIRTTKYAWAGFVAIASVDGEDIVFGVPSCIKSNPQSEEVK